MFGGFSFSSRFSLYTKMHQQHVGAGAGVGGGGGGGRGGSGDSGGSVGFGGGELGDGDAVVTLRKASESLCMGMDTGMAKRSSASADMPPGNVPIPVADGGWGEGGEGEECEGEGEWAGEWEGDGESQAQGLVPLILALVRRNLEEGKETRLYCTGG